MTRLLTGPLPTLRALFFGRHQPFLLLLLLFAVFRVLTIFLFRPGGFIVDHSDYDFYYEWGALLPMGYRTFENLWTVYPPLFPVFMLTIFEWSSRVPQWTEPRLIFHLYFGAAMVLFECLNFICIYVLARRLTRDEGARAPLSPVTAPPIAPELLPPVLYGFLFAPVYTMAGWFEPMPVFFLLLGLCLLTTQGRGWWTLSAAAAGLGFLVKLTPIMLVPVAIRWLGARLSWRAARTAWFKPHAPDNLIRPTLYTLIFFGVVIALGYPLVGYNLDLAWVSFQIQPLRPPWQSIWALIDGYYGYGLVPVSMRNLEGLHGEPWPTRIPWTLVSIGFLAIYLWLYTRPYAWQRIRTPIAFTGLSVTLLFLYSRGWSPQFLVWILVFVVLLTPTPRWIVASILLMVANLLESTIYLIMIPQQSLLQATVLLRTGLLILFCAELVHQMWPPGATAASIKRHARWGTGLNRTVWGVVAAALIGGTALTPGVINHYYASGLDRIACRATVEQLQAARMWPNATLVTQQPDVWREFNPFVYRDYSFLVIDGYDTRDRFVETASQRLDAERLRAHNAIHLADLPPELWWLARTDLDYPGSSPAAVWETFHQDPDVYILEEYAHPPCTLYRVADLRARPARAQATVEAADSMQDSAQLALRAHAWRWNPATNDLRVVLYWHADAPVRASYTVFVHALDAAGNLIGQQDNLPVNGLAPTNLWTPGELIRDPYTLGGLTELPHRLLVGLYTDQGRVTFQGPDGAALEAIEIPLNEAR